MDLVLHPVVDALQVGVDQVVEVTRRQVGRGAGGLTAGVVDRGVETPVASHGFVDEGSHLLFARDVGFGEEPIASGIEQQVERLLAARGIDVAHRDLRA